MTDSSGMETRPRSAGSIIIPWELLLGHRSQALCRWLSIWARGRTAKSLSLGYAHTCAVLDDDTLVCWGSNCNGQLGIGSTTTVSVPTKVDLGENKGALMVWATMAHTCAIRVDGELFCWGDNGQGKLGIGSSVQANSPTRVDLGTGLTAKFVSCMYWSTCAILSDDSVKCWGMSGTTGNGVSSVGSNIGDEPNEMGDNLPAIDLGTGIIPQSMVSGYTHTCVLFTNQKIKCFGRGNYGPLGYGDSNSRGDAPGEMSDNLPFVELGTGPHGEASRGWICALIQLRYPR